MWDKVTSQYCYIPWAKGENNYGSFHYPNCVLLGAHSKQLEWVTNINCWRCNKCLEKNKSLSTHCVLMSQKPLSGASTSGGGRHSTRLHRRQDSIQDEKTAKFIRVSWLYICICWCELEYRFFAYFGMVNSIVDTWILYETEPRIYYLAGLNDCRRCQLGLSWIEYKENVNIRDLLNAWSNWTAA